MNHKLHYKLIWDKVEILDKNKFYNKRLVSDMLFIKYQSNKLKEIDTEGLYQVYADILNKFH